MQRKLFFNIGQFILRRWIIWLYTSL